MGLLLVLASWSFSVQKLEHARWWDWRRFIDKSLGLQDSQVFMFDKNSRINLRESSMALTRSEQVDMMYIYTS